MLIFVYSVSVFYMYILINSVGFLTRYKKIFAPTKFPAIRYNYIRDLTTDLSPEDKERSHDDHEGGGEDLSQQLAGDHSLVGLARRTLHYIMIHRLHPQAVRSINQIT